MRSVVSPKIRLTLHYNIEELKMIDHRNIKTIINYIVKILIKVYVTVASHLYVMYIVQLKINGIFK